MRSRSLVLAALVLVASPATANGNDSHTDAIHDDGRIAVIRDASSSILDARKAVQELGEARDPRAVSTLIELLVEDHQGRTLAAEASFALFQIGKPSADALLKVVQGRDDDLRRWAGAHHVPDTWLLAGAAPILGDLLDARAEAPLLGLLRYENANKRTALVVRRRAAVALGRLHSKTAADRLADLATDENFQARYDFVQALVQIGGRRALPALVRAAADGDWEVRQVGLDGLTMLGDEREQPAYQQMIQHEADTITAGCQAHSNFAGCKEPAALVDRMLSGVRSFGRRLEAAAQCKQDVECWTGRLKDADAVVRERAVLEVARRVKGKEVERLFATLDDPDAAVQLEAVQSVEWALANDAEARTVGQQHAPSLEARLAAGKDTLAGARLAAPLQRILHRLRH